MEGGQPLPFFFFLKKYGAGGDLGNLVALKAAPSLNANIFPYFPIPISTLELFSLIYRCYRIKA